MARRTAGPVILVLDGDICESIPEHATRDWKKIADVRGMPLHIREKSSIRVVPPGSLVLAHGYGRFPEGLLPKGSNVVVVEVAGYRRPPQDPIQTPYGWLYQRIEAVGRTDVVFRSCLCRFVGVRAKYPRDEPPFLLLEPAEPGREWKEFIAGRGKTNAALADCKKRMGLYERAGFCSHLAMSAIDAIRNSKKKLQEALSQLASEIHQWADSTDEPAWFAEARTFAHDSLKNSICFLACDPERLRQLLAEKWEEYRRALSRLRCEWQKWADEQPTSKQRRRLAQFGKQCEALDKAIGKFIGSKRAIGGAAKKKAEEIRGIAWTIHQLLECVCES